MSIPPLRWKKDVEGPLKSAGALPTNGAPWKPKYDHDVTLLPLLYKLINTFSFYKVLIHGHLGTLIVIF